MATLTFQTRADLSEVANGKKIIASSVGPSGEACLLLVEPKYEKTPFGRDEQKGFAIFPCSKSLNHYPAIFVRFNGKILQQTDLPEVNMAYPSVQPLPSGEILLVGGRCHYRDGDPEKNAVVYAMDGMMRRQFVLGDGIADVQTTDDGLVWVSYFDEGVFGNFGWNKPIGSAGLVCFDGRGKIHWEFQPPPGVDAMADCYALNVAKDAVWACYYTDFPLVKVKAGKIKAWKNGVGGASALAVAGKRVALWGGYGNKHSRCVLQEMEAESLVSGTELKVVFPAGINPMATRVLGRDSTLHAFANDSWFALSLDLIP